MLSTRVVHITEYVHKLWPLLEAHRRELATHPDLMALDPQLDRYINLEKTGHLLSVLLEHQTAGIVGYSVNIVTNNLHYAGLKVCQNDVLYVSPSYRAEGGGRQLIRAVETNARNQGCKMLLLHAKPGTALDALLPKYGYAVQDVIHAKVLD